MSFDTSWLRRSSVLLGLVALLAPEPGAVGQTPPPSSPPPSVKIGDDAPDFTLSYLVPKADGGFENRQVTLSTFRGKQNVVLAFFPAAFSPG